LKDAEDFINTLNNLRGEHYRLPTEAEWEYAASGGNKSEHFKFSGSKNWKHWMVLW
jgi:formylglycine-generating enzyme required for sulfatase activity